MKASIAIVLLMASLPINAHQKVINHGNDGKYISNKGYAYEEKCFRYEYREDYIPGNSISPGYVKSYNEKVPVPCKLHNTVFNHSRDNIIPNTNTEYVNYLSQKNCNSNTTLGGLIGGGIAASLSKKDAYGWSIPLGAVLGASISNAECNK